LLGITFLVFAITRFVPGGPMDRMLQQAAGDAEGGGKKASNEARGGLSEEQMEELEEQFGLDKSMPVAYLQWLGLAPREILISKGEFGKSSDAAIGGGEEDADNTSSLVLRGDGRLVQVKKKGAEVVSAAYRQGGKSIFDDGWKLRYEDEKTRQDRFRRRSAEGDAVPSYPPRVVAFKTRFSGLLQGDLGRSTVYNDKVGSMILARVPVALYFGLLTAVITYAVCLPLGVLKALRHRTFIDSASSILIFIGYSIPGFALGAILLVHLGARMSLFPLFGFTSPDFAEMGTWDQVKDLVHHTVLPLLCYLVGTFAMLTMLTKNNLMDQLASDYVRTAVAKGLDFRQAVFRHALRNAFIPAAATMGQALTLVVGGSFLIERIFDIDGFGLMGFNALLERDSAIIMGTVTIGGVLLMLGNVLSDLITARLDPRIRFE